VPEALVSLLPPLLASLEVQEIKQNFIMDTMMELCN